MAESTDRKRRVRNPEGGVVYLEMYNPYVSEEDSQPLLESTQVTFPLDIIEKAQKLEKMMCPVKFVCVCDIFMSIYYFYYNFFLGLTLACVSTSGFMSTIYYKRSLMCAYLFYQYLQIGARFGNFLIFIVEISEPSDSQVVNATYALSNVEKAEIGAILAGLLVCQMVVGCYIQRFYMLLPSNEDRQRIQRVRI